MKAMLSKKLDDLDSPVSLAVVTGMYEIKVTGCLKVV